jgi:hypothetical protein
MVAPIIISIIIDSMVSIAALYIYCILIIVSRFSQLYILYCTVVVVTKEGLPATAIVVLMVFDEYSSKFKGTISPD